MRVLVTGGGGFIGRWTLGPLRTAGAEVHVVARRPAPCDVGTGVTWHRADLLDTAAMDAVVRQVRPTHLLHLAWCVTPGTYVTSLENLQWVGATIELVSAFAAAGGRRVVVAGTSGEYDPGGRACVEGRTPIRPATLYAGCKRGVYDVLACLAPQLGLSMAWGRVFFLYGPGEAPTRLVPQLICAGLARRTLGLRHPAHIRDYMHVADAGGALAALLASDVSDAVNIASGVPVTLADLAHDIGQYVGHPAPIASLPSDADPVPVLVADTARLCTEVRFAPQFSLADGLRDTIDWWKSRGDFTFV